LYSSSRSFTNASAGCGALNRVQSPSLTALLLYFCVLSSDFFVPCVLLSSTSAYSLWVIAVDLKAWMDMERKFSKLSSFSETQMSLLSEYYYVSICKFLHLNSI